MTSFRFFGFPAGAAVAMSLSNGSRVEPIDVQGWGMTETVSISTLHDQPAAVAPFQTTLEAVPAGFGIPGRNGSGGVYYDAQFTQIEYLWSVRRYVNDVLDTDYETSMYTAPVNVPAANRVKGTKFGKRIVHVIGRDDVVSGATNRFDFIVTAIDLATGASVTSTAMSKAVAHPDDYFSAAETFVVRKSGSSETGFPANAGISSSPSGAMTAGQSACGTGAISKFRVCVQKGEEFNGVWRGPSDANGTFYYIDTWGAAEGKPTFTENRWEPMRNMKTNYLTMCMSGIVFTGTNYWLAPRAGPMTVTLDGMDSDGAFDALAYEVSADTSTQWWAYSNCAGDSFGSTAGHVVGRIAAAIGCRWACTPDQSSDQKGGGGYGIRNNGGSEISYYSQCDGFLRQGWFNNAPGIQTTQGMFRFFGAGAGNSGDHRGKYFHIERCTFEAGSLTMTESMTQLTNVLIERCIFLGNHDNLSGMINFSGAGDVRNNIIIYPPSRPAQGSGNFEAGEGIRANYAAGSSFETPDARTFPSRFYNNTVIYLGSGTAPEIFTQGGGYSVIAANNILHAPYASTPVNAGAFSLIEVFTPRYDGYDERRGTPGDPQYRVNVDTATLTGAFQIGETVTGGTSGVSKVLRVIEGANDWFQSGQGYRFDADVVYDRLDQAPGFQRFTGGETLTGQTSGATIQIKSSAVYGQPFDTGWDLIGLIPKTITPTHMIEFDGGSGTFEEGATLTASGGKSATICQLQVTGSGTGRLWLRDVTGTFADNDAITDGTATANANGGQQSSGCGALWMPAERNPALGAALHDPVALLDFFGNRRPAYPSKGAFEAAF